MAHRDRGDRATEQFRKLFLGGLNKETTDETIESFYSKYGEICDHIVMRDGYTGRSRGFGFVTFTTEEGLEIALSDKPHVIDGKEIDVKRAMPRNEDTPEMHQSTKKVFIGGIGVDITSDHLSEYFSQYGNLTEVDVMTDKETGKSRGFGFISFDNTDSVDKIVLIRHHTIQGRSCEVKKAMPKGESGGGGSRGGSGRDRNGGSRSSGGGGYNRSGPRSGGGGGGGGGGRSYSRGGGGSSQRNSGGNQSQYGNGGYGGGSGGGFSSGGGYGDYDGGFGAWGAESSFGTNYGGNFGGGPMKGNNYSQKSSGPYGGLDAQTGGYGNSYSQVPTAPGLTAPYMGGYGGAQYGNY